MRCGRPGTTPGNISIPWRPLDLGGPSRRHLPRYAGDLLTPENLKALLTTADEPLEDYVAREYRRARLACRRPLWRPLGLDPETRRRERLLARRLRRCLARSGRVAHLGGWEHLVPWRDGNGLWQDWRTLSPGGGCWTRPIAKINLSGPDAGDNGKQPPSAVLSVLVAMSPPGILAAGARPPGLTAACRQLTANSY